MSTTWVTVILSLTALILVASNIVYLAAVSRDLWAFARDKGFPFSAWLGAIDEKRHIPRNASIVTSVFSGALALIYIGSPLAFYAITSLYVVSLLMCYCLSIGCCLWRRVYYPETMPPAAWSLGRWGIPVNNILAVVWSAWAFFWAFWPQTYPVTAPDFNWASPVFVGVLFFAMVYYYVQGRNEYTGPVVQVEGRGYIVRGQ